MPNLDQAFGWVLIAGGACYGSGSLTRLVRARESGVRLHAIPVQSWSGPFNALVCFAFGVYWLHWFRWSWPIGIALALSMTYQMIVLIAGIVSRRKTGLPWWRFWRRAIPHPGPVGPPAPRPSAEVDAETVAFLIQRIKNARFKTIRFSPGYDEQEVDIFLDKLIFVLGENGGLDPGLVRNAQFSTTRIRPGYAIQDVDELLDDVVRAI